MGFRETLSSARELFKTQFSSSAKTEVKKDKEPEVPEAKKTDDKAEEGAEWIKLNATITEDNVHKETAEKAAKLIFEKHKEKVQQAKQLISEQIQQINARQDTFVLEDQGKAINEVLKAMKVDRDTEVGAVVVKTSADAIVANMVKVTFDKNSPQTEEEIKAYEATMSIIKPLTPEGTTEDYLELKSMRVRPKEADPLLEEMRKTNKLLETLASKEDVQTGAELLDAFNEILERNSFRKKTSEEPVVESSKVKTKEPAKESEKEKEVKDMTWEELKEERKILLETRSTMSDEGQKRAAKELKEIEKAMEEKWQKAKNELARESIDLKERARQAMSSGISVYEVEASSSHPNIADPLVVAQKLLNDTANEIQRTALGDETKEIAKDWIDNVKAKWDLEKDREISKRTDIGQEDRATYSTRAKENEKVFKERDWGKRSQATEDAISALAKKSAERDSKVSDTELKKSIDQESARQKTQADVQEQLLRNMQRSTNMMGAGMGAEMDSESALKYTIWMNRLQLRPGDLKAVKDGENEDEIRTIFKRLVQRIEIDDDILNDPNNLKFLLFYMDHELKGKNPALVSEITDFVSNRIYFSQVASRFDSLAQDEFSEQTLTALNSEIRVNFAGTNADRMGKLYGAAMKYMCAMEDPEILKELFDSAKADGRMEDLQKFFQRVAQKANGVSWNLEANSDQLAPEHKEMVGEAKFAFRMQRFSLRIAEVDAAYKNGTNLGPAFNGKNLQDLLGSGFKVKRDIGNSKILQMAGQVEMFGFNTFLARKLGAALARAEIAALTTKRERRGREVTDEEKMEIEEKYSDSNIGINREGRVVNLTSLAELAQQYRDRICKKPDMTDEQLYEQIFSDHDQIVSDYFGKFKDAHATRTKLLGILTANPQDRIKMAGDVFKVWLHRAGDKLTPGSSVEDNGFGFSFFEDDYFTREEVERYKNYDKRHLAAMRMYFAIFEDAAASGIDPMVLRYWAEKGIIENVGVDKRAHMLDLLDLSLMKKSTMIGLQLGGLFWAIVSSMVKVTLNIK